MWYLQEVPDDAAPGPPVYYWFGGVLSPGRTIGRKNVDIRLKASSVSRTHAIIRVKRSSFHPVSHGTVPTVEDYSAYGTFLKYPPGHAANRATKSDGHHDRLDKDTPIELSEGALLAFGAPSAWWRVGWHRILVVPCGLDGRQMSRLDEVSLSTGLAVAKQTLAPHKWKADVSHLVMPVARATSTTFLRALVSGKNIVQPAWVDAVANMVAEACKAASLAANAEAASAATGIPSENLYIPPFCEEDLATFEAGVLTMAFDRSKNRESLFSNMTFVFLSEERQMHWCQVLDMCGGRSVLLQAGAQCNGGCILVATKGASSDIPTNTEFGVSCTESEIILSILQASADSIRQALRQTMPRVEPMVAAANLDVSTPPGDSDAETADNDAAEIDVASSNARPSNKRPWNRSNSVDNLEAQDDIQDPYSVDHPEKRVRHESADNLSLVADSEELAPVRSSDNVEAINPRSFFTPPDKLSPYGDCSNLADASAAMISPGAATDVRRFRRPAAVLAPRVPLQRAAYVDDQLAPRHAKSAEVEYSLHPRSSNQTANDVDVIEKDVEEMSGGKSTTPRKSRKTHPAGRLFRRAASRSNGCSDTED